MLNGVTKVIMTKADVLDSFKELNVCVNYCIGGKETDRVPFQLMQANVIPAYKTFEGWNSDTMCIKNSGNLPVQMHLVYKSVYQSAGVLRIEWATKGTDY